MRVYVQIAAAAAAVIVSGCGTRFFSDRTTDPVIEDYIRPSSSGKHDEFGVLSITASKRNAYIKLKKDKVGVLCAEPPPDVGEAFAKAFAVALSGKEPKGPEAEGKLSSSAATAIAPLVYRTQGLQMYRDAASHLCFAYMNGIINRDQFIEEDRKRWQAATKLIETELKHPITFQPQGTGGKAQSGASSENGTTTNTEASPKKSDTPKANPNTDAGK